MTRAMVFAPSRFARGKTNERTSQPQAACAGRGGLVPDRRNRDREPRSRQWPSRQHDNRDAVPAAVAIAKRAAIGNSFSVAGEFCPYQEIEIHAKVAGYMRKINVDIGDRVKTGQVLAVLEMPELMAQLQGAGAGVRHSQQEIERAQNEVTRDEAQHAALHASYLTAETGSEARPGLIAQQELDDAQAKDRSAEAQVESAKSALSAARQQLEMSQANNSRSRRCRITPASPLRSTAW